MAFKFQINPDVRFIHDEAWLAKADENRPKILSLLRHFLRSA